MSPYDTILGLYSKYNHWVFTLIDSKTIFYYAFLNSFGTIFEIYSYIPLTFFAQFPIYLNIV